MRACATSTLTARPALPRSFDCGGFLRCAATWLAQAIAPALVITGSAARRTCFCALLLFAAHGQAAPPTLVRVAYSAPSQPANPFEVTHASLLIEELLKALFSLTPDYQTQFHGFPWARAQRLVEHGDMDLFVTFPSASRRGYANFSVHPLFVLDYGNIVYDATGAKAAQIEAATSFKDLRDLIFVSQDTVEWETENVPSYLRRYMVNGSVALMHMTFQRQMGDFFIMPPEQARAYAKHFGYERKLGMKKVDFIPNGQISFHIGIRKSYPQGKALMAALETAMKQPAFLAKRRRIESKYQ